MTKRSRHLAACLALAMAALLALPAAAAEKVRIALFSWPGYGYWFVIKEKNLAPNLDLDIQIIEDPLQSFGLMAAGQLDVASSTSEYGPIAADQGLPIRSLGLANLSYGTDQIIAAEGIGSPADVAGKKVAVMVGGLQQIMVGKWLEDAGVDPKGVEYVNVIMDDAAAAMMGGDIAAGELWEPYASQVLAGLPGAKQITNSRDEAWTKTGLLADGLYFNADFIRDRRAVAVELLGALYKAIDFWKSNPAEANQIIADGLKFSVADVESVIGKDGTGLDAGLYPYTFLESARFCGAAPGDPPFGQTNGGVQQHWDLVSDWWVKFELIKGKSPMEQGTDCSLHKELYDAGLQNQLTHNP